MAADSLCIGDVVCLYSEEAYGFVYALQTSPTRSELAIYARQSRDKPDIPDPQVISFEVGVANRYKLNKKYRKIKTKSDGDPDNISLKTQAAQADIGAEAENIDNVSEQRRLRGKKVLYGQVIQLKHVFTNKYIHVSTTQTSRTESSNMQVDMRDYNAKHSQFKIMPRYKVKAEGDIVQVNDQIVLESVKSPGQYLHMSKGFFDSHSVYAQSHELNLTVRQSGFTIYRRYKPEKSHENMVKAGVPLRLFHKEVEAYMVAEGLFGDETTEDVHLRVRPIDQNNPKTLFPSTSAITYWHIEIEDGPINGNIVRWEQQCRIRHMTTRKYLMVDGDKLTLTTEHLEPKTVFRLHPVIKEKDEIEFETYCRVEHVVSGSWLNATGAEYSRKEYKDRNVNDSSMAGLQWTRALLQKISMSKTMQYNDAFTMQRVEEEEIANFNYMAGMVPFLQKLIKDKKAGQDLTSKQTFETVETLTELKRYMIVNSVPNKQRQKLLRNLRIVELLVRILQLPYRGAPDQNNLSQIMVECYDVVYTYLMGDSRKNELYMAKNIDFFNSQISCTGDIGLNAAHMVMELVKDNRKIVDRITHTHIDGFVDLLQQNKNYRYLDLLSVLCVCDGVSIPDNQTYITDVWLKKGKKNCVFHTELGQAIGKDTNIVYVSNDNKRTWTALHDFVRHAIARSAQRPNTNHDPGFRNFNNVEKEAEQSTQRNIFRNLRSDEEFLFLDHQLELFGKLCYGRNEYAIKVITDELGYLTWEEAFTCLSNENLPDQLRAKYCHLVIALFVDVGENASVLDRLNLTFVYEDVGATIHQVGDEADAIVRDNSPTKRYFPALRDWISRFLDSNKDMTASEIGHNMLVEQVLRLVHYLTKYGYYGEMEDIKQLLGPLLSLMDGTNDKPYPASTESPGLREVVERYRKETRYKESPEAKAVTDAKHEAMQVLDLFFNYRFNIRLERFVQEFKETYSKSHHDALGTSTVELVKLLHEEYDICDNQSTNNAAIRRLKEIFEESSFFTGFPIKDVLMDLSYYEYDQMVVSSMSLLNRYYSSHDNLFKRAVQAQVLITERSGEVLRELKSMLPVMQRLTSAKMSQEQTKVMVNILEKLTGFCHLENEPEEEHPMNQSILYNHGILSILFDLLSQEIDVRLMNQYQGTKLVFQKSFQLMKAMARGNAVIQQRLFDRLDMLLTIQGAESDMAETLTEVFTGNRDTCMKILPHQIQKVTSLVAQHTSSAPQFLELLSAIVKVEEINLPLKRNQGYVMKSFMEHRAAVAFVLDQPAEDRMKLLCGEHCPDMDYMMALVDLLATCAEGENRFIESICQTIFSVDMLIDILNNPKIDNNLKRPFARFLLWVYLNTAGGMMESGAGDLPHDSKMWAYINSMNTTLTTLTEFTKNGSETVTQLLKKPPGRSADLIYQIMDDPNKLNTVLSEQGHGDWKKHHGSLHYIMDAALPLLQVFFRSYYRPDSENFPDEADHVDKLANSLVEFSRIIGPLISNATHMKAMVGSMNVILSASTLPVKVMEEFQELYGGTNKVQDIRSEARKKYEDHYHEEEDLNAKLNIFAINFSVAYGGFNDIRTQIGHPSDEDYTEIGGDEELPLGQEFQDHTQCFISDKKGPSKFAMTEKLVQQLQISASNTHMSERERLNQEELDVKCLQLLRGILHNEIIKLPEDWEFSSKGHTKQLRRVEDAQSSLNSHSAMLKVLPHLSKTQDDIVREVLAFLAAMLFGGNEDVQKSLIEYFLGTREEKFFFAVKSRIQLSAVATKEKRSLMAQHQAKVDEAIEQAKALHKAMKSGRMAAQEIHAANQAGSTLLDTIRASKSSLRPNRKGKKGASKSGDLLKARYGGAGMSASRTSLRSSSSHTALTLAVPTPASPPDTHRGIEMRPIQKKEDKSPLIPILHNNNNKVGPNEVLEGGPEIKVEDLDESELAELAATVMEDTDLLDYKDDGYITLVLKILGLMCDGQNKTVQDYLREQPDNIKSVNLVAETARFLQLIYSNINGNTIELVKELLNTLVEFCSANATNQAVVFDNKICDYINFILRAAQFHGCSPRRIQELRKAIGVLIISLIEENPRQVKSRSGAMKTVGIAKEVSETLDAESIWKVAKDSYMKTQFQGNKKNTAPRLAADLHELAARIGFDYFHILKRIMDMREEEVIRKENLLKTPEDVQAWNYYEEGTLSIEVVKNDDLQKLYFRVKDKSVLREDVKEKFKYEVDRSSPSNKLREFMDWSQDIMTDIKYTRRVLSNVFLRFFIKYWYAFNIGMIVISFLFFLLIMITWREPLTATGASDYASHIPAYDYDPAVVQGITYALGGIHNLFSLGVLISYFITNHPTFPNCKKRIKRVVDRYENYDRGEERESHLEVKFFSFKTIWYILLFLFSILGTVFYGYFFSFHLLHIAEFNQLLKRAIMAVSKNGWSLILVFVFGLVFLYIYALVAFAIYREVFDSTTGHYCQTFYQCMTTAVHRGLIDGMYNFLAVPEGKPFAFHLHKALFDVTFFIIITTIGLNIIFGIIVDTFSELRDNKWQVDSDMTSTCFICSRNSYDFEKQGCGFSNHVKFEHNQWAYLFFFIHLDETRPNDYTAIELYVSRLLEREKFDFFPLNRALSLQHEEDGNEQRLDMLMSQVTYLVSKIKSEESQKQKEEEKRRQLEWEKKHKTN